MFYKFPEDPNFKDIVDKYEIKSNTLESKRKYMKQDPIQIMLRNFISVNTIYDSILVYHATGRGKTLAAIGIAEGFKELIGSMFRKVFVLTKNDTISMNFMNELLSRGTGDAYKLDVDTSDMSAEEIRKQQIKKVRQYYEFENYGAFVNRVFGIKDRNSIVEKGNEATRHDSNDKITDLSNRVIIVDEAHNLTGNTGYEALIKVLQNSYNYRIVLLTATPMANDQEELFELCNLLNATDILPIRKELYKQGYLVMKKDSRLRILSNGLPDITEKGFDELKKRLIGKVSYFGIDKSNFPYKYEQGNTIFTGFETKIVMCPMSLYQFSIYKQVLFRERAENDGKDSM